MPTTEPAAGAAAPRARASEAVSGEQLVQRADRGAARQVQAGRLHLLQQQAVHLLAQLAHLPAARSASHRMRGRAARGPLTLFLGSPGKRWRYSGPRR